MILSYYCKIIGNVNVSGVVPDGFSSVKIIFIGVPEESPIQLLLKFIITENKTGPSVIQSDTCSINGVLIWCQLLFSKKYNCAVPA